MFQFFKGQNGSHAHNHYILKDIKSLHYATINNIRPGERGEVLNYDDLQHPYNSLNKTMIMPYMSVSLKYDSYRKPGGSTAIKYYPVILIDLDFKKSVKKFYINTKNHKSKIYNFILDSVENTIKLIYKSYPYTLIKKSYSGSLHILIHYTLIDEAGEVLIGEQGVDIDSLDTFKRMEIIHKKTYDYFYHIYKTLISKQNKPVLYLDSNVGGKIAQLMILTYDNGALYNDFKYELHINDIYNFQDLIKETIDEDAMFKLKRSDEELVKDNNLFLEEIFELYNSDNDFMSKLFKDRIIKELSSLLSHHNFKWVASLWFLSLENRERLYNLIIKENIYKGSSIPFKTFNSFNNYIEDKHNYHIKRKDNYTIALKNIIKIY